MRAVLDTNVLLAALLFANGQLSWLRPCWQRGVLVPVLAEPTMRELLRVLTYPKFRLSPADRERLLEDLLPWCESWTGPIPISSHRVRDPHDQVFLDLALAAATPVLVSGDADLLAVEESVNPLLILSPADFHTWLELNR
jgi:putative PIN family toxin of toxin-antitoxin system